MNLECKVLEIRDEGTHIPALAMRMTAADPVCAWYIHGRCGFPRDGSGIVLMLLDKQQATVDPYDWAKFRVGPRTVPNAHHYIYENFDKLNDGDVIDVRVILGETETPAPSDRFYKMKGK